MPDHYVSKFLNFRMANTLAHIKNLHWLVIEDENHTVKAVERLLQRTELPYTYFASKTVPGYPRESFDSDQK